MQQINDPNKSSYILEMKPSFPRNLFHFHEYNGLKTLSVFFLITTLIYFVWSFIGLLGNHNYSYSTLGGTSYWFNPFKTLLQSGLHIFQDTIEILNLVIIALPLIITFCFTWIIFDPRNVAMYILSITNVLFGIIEILSPIDFLPDFVPLVGSLDDGIIGGGLITYGTYLFFQAARNKDKIKTVMELIGKDNEDKALQMLLEQQGISLTRATDN